VTLLQEGRFLFVNRAFVSMFGFKEARSLIGKTPAELASESFIRTDDRFLKSWTRITLTTKGSKAQCVMKDGKTLWVEGHHSVIQLKGSLRFSPPCGM